MSCHNREGTTDWWLTPFTPVYPQPRRSPPTPHGSQRSFTNCHGISGLCVGALGARISHKNSLHFASLNLTRWAFPFKRGKGRWNGFALETNANHRLSRTAFVIENSHLPATICAGWADERAGGTGSCTKRARSFPQREVKRQPAQPPNPLPSGDIDPHPPSNSTLPVSNSRLCSVTRSLG